MLLPEIFRKKQFIVVDDYESMRIMIAEHLKQMGVERIVFAKSGNEAFKIIKQNYGGPEQIDFVFADMIMPDGNGIELVMNLRADDNLKFLPILMVTSRAEINIVLDAVRAGVSSYIIKPWQIDDLCRKIVDSDEKSKSMMRQNP